MYDAVLFPTDGSEGSETALDHALELATDQDARLYVLHVVAVPSPAVSLHELIADRMLERGSELVERIAQVARERDLQVETAVLEGDPAETIVQFAASNGIDVIVMPTHGRPELTKAIVGSVTDKVIRTGDVPVVVTTFEK
ncbi:MAG: universal stress protein [Halobacteriota archaeon]